MLSYLEIQINKNLTSFQLNPELKYIWLLFFSRSIKGCSGVKILKPYTLKITPNQLAKTKKKAQEQVYKWYITALEVCENKVSAITSSI